MGDFFLDMSVYVLFYKVCEDVGSILVEDLEIFGMSTVHKLERCHVSLTEVLKSRHNEHRLLVSVLHIVVGYDDEHRGILCSVADMEERCGVVDDDSSRVDSALLQNVEVSGGLSCIVNETGYVGELNAMRREPHRIEAEHH